MDYGRQIAFVGRACSGTMAPLERSTLTFMTLGDGDFSYSLDMAQYLAALEEKPARKSRIIATGIDSLHELNAKYRDAPFLLKQLEYIDKNEESLSVTVCHGVNAVQPPPSTKPNEWKAQHVIFNHPHIGTEDAALHSRFLSHVLHTASLHWMRDDGGILHLTLVKGQYERWKCNEAAERHGLVLLERNAFVPPPGGGHYQHRRHQTGKSFASRAIGGSETFTFGRRNDEAKYVATCLPWQQQIPTTPVEDFPCPHCKKSFREERSRRTHVKAVHSDETNKKRKRADSLQCLHCKDSNSMRVFPHQQALDDHIRAKHTGIHSVIKPDWVKETEISTQMTEKQVLDDRDSSQTEEVDENRESTVSYGSCSVCGLIYRAKKDEVKHSKEFVPLPFSERTLEEYAAVANECSFCKKGFRDERAQRQHENACAKRSRNRQSLLQ